MSAPLGRRGLALLLVTTAALAAGSASPAAERPTAKTLNVFGLGQGIGHVRSRVVHRQLRFLSLPPGAWGGVYTVKSGAQVTIQSSAAYPVDPAVNQARADFVDSLVHGSEIAKVKIYFAPPAEVGILRDQQAQRPLACGRFRHEALVDLRGRLPEGSLRRGVPR